MTETYEKRKRHRHEERRNEGAQRVNPANKRQLYEFCEHAADLVGTVVVLGRESLGMLLEGRNGAFRGRGDLRECGECGVDRGGDDGVEVSPEAVAVAVSVLQAGEEGLDAGLPGH
jgi:hypothetical protein